MRRLPMFELVKFLQCPYCRGKLKSMDLFIACTGCERKFTLFRHRPVLIRDDNELFPPSAYAASEGPPDRMIERRGRLRRLKRLLPSMSVNVAREGMLKRIVMEHGAEYKVILVLGCGNQTSQLQRQFTDDKTTFIFCDIDKNADIDIFCDAHDLPFKNEIFDGVISTAVLEHVMYPDKVVSEMHRILKQDGFVYSEIPFLQSVHEGAYDFTRYTLQGHRRLFEYFKEVDAGMVAGPGTALLWSIVDFSRAVMPTLKLSALAGIMMRIAFFWVKYFDILLKNKPIAIDACSCSYFCGIRSLERRTANEISDTYGGNPVNHLQ